MNATRTRPARPLVTGELPASYDTHFRLRVMQDAFTTAAAAQWQRRAEQLEAARPRPGDFRGVATTASLTACYVRLTEAATACRARAELGDVAALDFADALLDASWEGAA